MKKDFKIRFLKDFHKGTGLKKGDVVIVSKMKGENYINLGFCEEVRPIKKRKTK